MQCHKKGRRPGTPIPLPRTRLYTYTDMASFVRTWPCSDDADDAATPREHEWAPAVATTHRTALRQVNGADLMETTGHQIASVRRDLTF